LQDYSDESVKRIESILGQFPFEWIGGDLFLYGWCQKRIFDGKEDNIWSKYQICVLEKLKEVQALGSADERP
jgi:hypothetical protein